MSEKTTIEWCDHSWSPWIGCSKVSPGCAHCYAEEMMDHRFGRVKWGDDGTRKITSEANWRKPLTWDRKAKKEGIRRRVFCSPTSDVFEDRPEVEAPRLRLFALINATPHLDWLLLTKRPQFMRTWLEKYHITVLHPSGPGVIDNLWLGVSVENQEATWRIDELLKTPAAVRFLSCEPLLSSIDLCRWLYSDYDKAAMDVQLLTPPGGFNYRKVDWVIAGGESGSQARPCHFDWVRSLVQQCDVAGVPCFVKQLGANPQAWGAGDLTVTNDAPPAESRRLFNILDPKGGDLSEWPEDLRIRQFPQSGGRLR